MEDNGVLKEMRHASSKLSVCVNWAFLSLAWMMACLTPQRMEAADPIYQGRPLSDWLVLNKTGDPSAREAIREIGISGIPTLIVMLNVKEDNRWSTLNVLKDRELTMQYTDKNENLVDIRRLAVAGFAVLGTNADSAIPQITKIFRDADENCFEAAEALMQIGPQGLSALTNAANDEGLQGVLVYACGQRNSADPKVVTQILICALKNPDELTRGNAARFLVGKDPQLAMPALIPMLDETNFYTLNAAVMALGSYGSAAKSVAPKLFSIYTNDVLSPNLKFAHDISVQLMKAMRNIDRNVAANAENYMVEKGPLGVADFGWAITELPDGKELIAGGFFHAEIPDKTNNILSRAQLFDPTTGRRTEINPMNVARCEHKATLLKDGKLLVVGGKNIGGDGKLHALSSQELYDPNTGMWTLITNRQSAL